MLAWLQPMHQLAVAAVGLGLRATYQIEQQLGRSSAACSPRAASRRSYEAIDVRTKRSIAIKQIRCPDADHAARDCEIEAHGKLRHATIAELLDYGVEECVPFRLAFPLYGASVRKLLDDALATRTCLLPQMTASILVAVGEALAECHASK